ncbi:hypothetical protein [Williamsia muralis]|nr:hypothetical protein [Williamsia muralis]
MHPNRSDIILTPLAAVMAVALFLTAMYGLFVGTCTLFVAMGWAA